MAESRPRRLQQVQGGAEPNCVPGLTVGTDLRSEDLAGVFDVVLQLGDQRVDAVELALAA